MKVPFRQKVLGLDQRDCCLSELETEQCHSGHGKETPLYTRCNLAGWILAESWVASGQQPEQSDAFKVTEHTSITIIVGYASACIGNA